MAESNQDLKLDLEIQTFKAEEWKKKAKKFEAIINNKSKNDMDVISEKNLIIINLREDNYELKEKVKELNAIINSKPKNDMAMTKNDQQSFGKVFEDYKILRPKYKSLKDKYKKLEDAYMELQEEHNAANDLKFEAFLYISNLKKKNKKLKKKVKKLSKVKVPKTCQYNKAHKGVRLVELYGNEVEHIAYSTKP